MTYHTETGSKDTVTRAVSTQTYAWRQSIIMLIQVVVAVLATAVSCGTKAAAGWMTTGPPDPACLEKDVATGIR
jgi:maltodextrin utilization protein YvdJ